MGESCREAEGPFLAAQMHQSPPLPILGPPIPEGSWRWAGTRRSIPGARGSGLSSSHAPLLQGACRETKLQAPEAEERGRAHAALSLISATIKLLWAEDQALQPCLFAIRFKSSFLPRTLIGSRCLPGATQTQEGGVCWAHPCRHSPALPRACRLTAETWPPPSHPPPSPVPSPSFHVSFLPFSPSLPTSFSFFHSTSLSPLHLIPSFSLSCLSLLFLLPLYRHPSASPLLSMSPLLLPSPSISLFPCTVPHLQGGVEVGLS